VLLLAACLLLELCLMLLLILAVPCHLLLRRAAVHQPTHA
jgi:hypothetical protein